jgi:hypothetical protein
MEQTTTLTPSTQEKFMWLADLLRQASDLLRNLASGESARIMDDDEFWQMSDELAQKFSHLSDQELDQLVNRAVRWARQQPASST